MQLTYQPGSPVEEDLVNEMVACRWRMQRIRMIETALMDSEMQRELPEEETPSDPGYTMAFAFRRLVDGSRAISLASRYESRLHRIHERSHRTLRELQQIRPSVPPTPAASPAPTDHDPSISAGADPEPPASAHNSSVSAGTPVPPPPDEKSRNEPTPNSTKSHQRLSIVRHRGFRAIDIMKLRRFRQSRNA